MAAPQKFFRGQPTIVGLRKVKRRMPIELQLALRRHGRFVERIVRQDRFEKYPGYKNEDRSRQHLYSRTGKLARSIKTIELEGQKGVRIEAGRGVGDDRATANEFGKILTGDIPIPLGDNITPTGRRRFATVAEALAAGASFWRNPKTGKLLVTRKGLKKSKPFEFLFVIASRVVIPPRFKFRDTIRSEARIVKDRRSRLTNATRKAISDAGFKVRR